MAYLRHSSLPLEPPPHSIVNTLRLPPAGVDAFEAVGLVAVEGVGVLLHDLDVFFGCDHLLIRVSISALTPHAQLSLQAQRYRLTFAVLRWCRQRRNGEVSVFEMQC